VKKNILLLVGFFAGYLPVSGQTDFNKVSFPSPDAAAFVKYIEKPVSLYNGQIAVNVPLYVIKDGDVEIPITLNYNTSGIKVAEEAGMVGLGWNLSLGGMIDQQIKGSEDNLNTKYAYNNPATYLGDADFFSGYFPPEGYLQKSYPADPDTYYNRINSGFVNYFQENAEKYKPDIFFYSFGGLSGKFYIDQYNDSIYQEKQDPWIYFEQTNINGKPGFKAIAPDGTTYFFNGITGGSRISGSGTTNPVSKTYYLSEVVYPSGQVVRYIYQKLGLAQNCLTQSEKIETRFDYYSEYMTSNRTASEFDAVVLTTISTTNIAVTLDYSAREDIRGFSKKLDRITIKNLNTNEEDVVNFYTSYFTSSNTGKYFGSDPLDNYDLKRLKLDSAGVAGQPTHKFVYNATMLPAKRSFAVDYWGFFNGKTDNETFIPKVSYLNFFTSTEFDDYGGCRATSETHAKACVLDRIIYPTTGETRITYESNTFDNYKIPTIPELQAYGAFNAVRGITVADENAASGGQTSYFFELTEERLVGITGKISYGRGVPEDVTNAAITLTKFGSPGSSIFSWKHNSENGGNFQFNGTLTPGYYSLNAYLPDELGDQTIPEYVNPNVLHAISKGSIYFVPLSSTLTYSKGAGLRVSEITQIPQESLPSFGKRFVYNMAGSNGMLMSEPKFVQKKTLQLAKPTIRGCCNVDGVCWTKYTVILDEGYIFTSNSHTPVSYGAAGALVGYTKVKEYQKNDGDNSYIEYEFYNWVAPGHPDYVEEQIPYNNGLIRYEKYFDASGSVVKQVERLYANIIEHHFFGMAYEDIYRGPTINDYSCFMVGLTYDRYNILFYALPSRQVPMTKRIETMNGLIKEEFFSYYKHGLVYSEKQTVNGKTIETKTRYNTNVLPDHGERYILANLRLDKTIQVNGVITGKEEFVYSKIGESTYYLNNIKIPHYNISSYKFYPTGSAQFTSSAYAYNLNRVVEVTSSSSSPTVYLWAYKGTRPIAEIRGATLSELSTLISQAGLVLNDAVIINYDNSESGLRSKLNVLQNSLPSGVQMTHYTYDILNGITSSSDVNGQTTYFKYDTQGRLSTLKDHDGNIIKNHIYHYKDQ
jgi:YD repeat-containing protein